MNNNEEVMYTPPVPEILELVRESNDTHEWMQEGNDLVCRSCPHHHGSLNVVPQGKMLSKNEKGEYVFIPMT